MRAILFLLILSMTSIAATNLDRAEQPFINLLGNYNPGFESGKAAWTSTTGTFTYFSSGAAVGTATGSYSASASGNTLRSTRVTVPTGLFGKDCVASVLYKNNSSSAYTLEVVDGSDVVQGTSSTETSMTVYKYRHLPFTCPSSGTIAFRVKGTASSQSAIYLDQVYLGINNVAGSQSNPIIAIEQSSTPSNPPSGYLKVYPKTDDLLYILNSSGTETQLLTQSPQELRQNWLYNSNLDWWQRGTLFVAAGFTADRWYASRTGSGSPDCDRQTGSSSGAIYGLQCFNFATNSSSGVGLRQVLPKQDGALLHNKTVSLQVKVKAVSAVNQVTLALNYSTSESAVGFATNVISSTTASVDSSGFTTVNLSNVAVGTSYTKGTGTLQFSIYTSGVSSGGVGDIGNGMIIEQPMLVIGSAPTEYKNRFASADLELQALQAFYEKSYDIATDPGSVTTIGSTTWSGLGVAGQPFVTVPFKTSKHKFPTVTYYNCRTGASGTSSAIWDTNTGSTEYGATAASSPNACQTNFKVTTNSGTPPTSAALCLQWTADADF